MKKLILAAAVLAVLGGCTKPDEAIRVLEGAGYTNVKPTGHRWTGCSDSDDFATGFMATGANGKPVNGVVCSGIFKGATIRVD